jgi:hypothetical protein
MVGRLSPQKVADANRGLGLQNQYLSNGVTYQLLRPRTRRLDVPELASNGQKLSESER